MNRPTKFLQTDPDQLTHIIRDYPLATVITISDSGITADHLPLLIDTQGEKHILKGHIAKANPLWETAPEDSEVLVIFNGPNCYISPNYYPTKKETGKAVPTWNYVVVHIKGRISFIHDQEWIRENVELLTLQHEAHQTEPWSISDAPEDYIQKMLNAVVGIQIDINTVSGTWKLSQNQPVINQLSVIEELFQSKDQSHHKIAELIKAQNSHTANSIS